MKKCKQGYYYCYTEKKCKKIPMGYHIGARGYLAKDNDNDNEGEDTTKNGNGNGNGNGGNGNGGGTVSEEGLRDWFGKSKSKDGKKGWVNVVTGGTCASDKPGEGTPKCVSSAKRASMTKAERLSAQRRKKKADPGQQQKSGAAKPTYVSTDPKKKMKKEEVEVTEAKDKKGKGSGSKDACYHKVKSRYSVWPSAYASGALVKCRKVGAANWGNKSESVELSNWRDDFKATEYEFTDIIKPEPIKGGVIEEGQKCWKGYEKKGTKKMFGKTYNNCVKKEETEQDGPEPTAKQRRGAMKNIRQNLNSLSHEDPNSKRTKQKQALQKARLKAYSEESDKVKEEVEQLDELSTDTLKSYENKAAKDRTKRFEKAGTQRFEARKAKQSGNSKKASALKKRSDKNADKAFRREAGMDQSYAKRAKAHGQKVGYTPDRSANVPAQKSNLVSRAKGSVRRALKNEGYAPGDVDQKVGAVTAIPKKDQDAAKARLLAKAKAKREKMGEDFEKEVPSGDVKKLVKKAVKRIDQNVSGHVDKKDKSMGEYGEFVPSPDGKSKIVTSVKKESLSNWRNEIEEGAAWTKKAGKNKEGGLNEKGRKSYEKENPGSDLKRPSKEVGNPRRKSFCARMKGMKKKLTSSKTANDPDSRINKSLRAWNC